MLLAVVAVIAGMAAGLAAGRRPRWAGAHLSGPDLALLSAGLLAAVVSRAPVGRAAVALAVVTYVMLGAFAVRHRAHPGLALVATGLVANLVVVAVNGGMPVTSLAAGTVRGLHHGLSAADHLTGLADVISIPAVGVLASPGDLAVALGVAVATFAWTAPAPAPGPVRPNRRRPWSWPP